MDLQELAKYVRLANGSFDTALTLVMASRESQEISSPVEAPKWESVKVVVTVEAPVSKQETARKADAEGGLEFDANADLTRLRAKYGKHVSGINSILGENVQDEYTILKTLEKTKGDTQEAVLELLSLPERVNRSELSSSREALRLSASNIASSSSLRSSSGIEQLPVNLSLGFLDIASPPSAPAPSPSSSYSPSEENSITSEASEEELGTTATGSDDGDYDFDEDDDSWLTDPNFEEVRQAVFGTDFITQMLQEEYDLMVARELAKELASGSAPTNSIFAIASANQRQEEAQIRPPVPRHPIAVPLPPSGTSAPTHHQKWDPFRVPKKKQQPSGPKFYALPVPSSSSPAAAPVVTGIPKETHDKALLEEFIHAHPVIEKGKREEPMKVLKARPDEALSIATQIKQLKQLYAARIAAIQAAESEHKKKKSAPLAPSQVQELQNGEDIPASASNSSDPAAAANSAPALFDITEQLSKLLQNAQAKSVEQCLAIQKQEIRELRSAFGSDRVHISESVPSVIAIALDEPSFEVSRPAGLVGTQGEEQSRLSTTVSFRNPLHLLLIISLPPLYPDIAPSLCIRSMSPACTIEDGDLKRLQDHLHRSMIAERPGLSNLAALAELWLCEDSTVRKAALLDYQSRNVISVDGEHEHQLFASLNLIFNFESDYRILHTNDILSQRDKLLKRAILVLINGPGVVNPPTPGNPDKPDFPVKLPNSDEIDEEASLRGLGLTVAAVRLILQHYNWNLGKLSNAYLNSLAHGTYERFLSDAGVAPVADRYAMEYHLPRALNEILECPTCLEYLPFHAMFGLVCGHMLCKSCYSEYVDYEVSRGVGLSSLSCPSPGCKYIVDQISLSGLLSSSRWSQYVNMTVSQYVQANPSLSWCPSTKGCEYLVQVGALDSEGISSILAGTSLEVAPTVPSPTSKPPLVIQCKCSYTFCSYCQRIGGHFPASCAECDHWDKLHPGDAPLRNHDMDNVLSLQFVKRHTKGCPACGAAISKNGGCVHMLCVACRHEFCWVCFEKWNTSHYACSESSSNSIEEVDINIKSHKSFDSLLARHREFSYTNISKLRHKLTTAMYRSDKEYEKKRARAANGAQMARSNPDRLLTIEDIPVFIEALELIYLTHYLISNACKAGYSLSAQQISTSTANHNLLSLIHRGLEDLQFLTNSFLPDPLKKYHIYHVQAGIGPIKATIKLIVNHLNTVRMNHLALLASRGQ